MTSGKGGQALPDYFVTVLTSHLLLPCCFLPICVFLCQIHLMFGVRMQVFLVVQVLTVHSPFRVENLTNQQLEFNVHLFRGPQALGAPSKGAAAISMVPNRPLSPGQQTYLPVPAIWYVTTPQLQPHCLNIHCQALKVRQD